MAKAKKLTNEEEVAGYFQSLKHPLINLVMVLRKIVLAADKEIGEQIKWNSPSYYYTGPMKSFNPKEYKRDIVVFNLHKKDYVLLVFPTGALIKDEAGLLEGKFPDTRKTIKFTRLEEVNDKGKDLQAIIKMWLQSIDK